jgi:hypothetical protein
MHKDSGSWKCGDAAHEAKRYYAAGAKAKSCESSGAITGFFRDPQIGVHIESGGGQAARIALARPRGFECVASAKSPCQWRRWN